MKYHIAEIYQTCQTISFLLKSGDNISHGELQAFHEAGMFPDAT
jgi:hypothetical protein